MKSFNYKSKYHYIVKYFVIAFPLIFILVLTLIDSITFSDYMNYLTDLSISLDVRINSWYFEILDLLGFRSEIYDSGGFFGLLLVYPLYVFWVYVFDLILDVFTIIPKLAHKFLNKLGGEKYE